MIAPNICGNPTESFTGKAGSCKKSTPQDSTAAQAGQGFHALLQNNMHKYFQKCIDCICIDA